MRSSGVFHYQLSIIHYPLIPFASPEPESYINSVRQHAPDWTPVWGGMMDA
jgi:hypothetical protein